MARGEITIGKVIEYGDRSPRFKIDFGRRWGPRYLYSFRGTRFESKEMAQAILIAPDAAFLDRVAASIERLVGTMERADIIRQSLAARGDLVPFVFNPGRAPGSSPA